MVLRFLTSNRWYLLLPLLCGCMSGVKYVGLGEPCGRSSSEIEGPVLCRQGLVCFPDRLPVDATGSGHCQPECQSTEGCSGLIVACCAVAGPPELKACLSAEYCDWLVGMSNGTTGSPPADARGPP